MCYSLENQQWPKVTAGGRRSHRGFGFSFQSHFWLYRTGFNTWMLLKSLRSRFPEVAPSTGCVASPEPQEAPDFVRDLWGWESAPRTRKCQNRSCFMSSSASISLPSHVWDLSCSTCRCPREAVRLVPPGSRGTELQQV